MSFYNKPVFFYAFNNTAQTLLQGNYFALSNYENVQPTGLTGRVALETPSGATLKAYVYGEIQTNITTGSNNYDVRIPANTLLLSEGFQCRNNNTVGGMDDGVYALASGEAGILLQDTYTPTTEKTDANQTRLYGVYSA
jgi:hypothetical protein